MRFIIMVCLALAAMTAPSLAVETSLTEQSVGEALAAGHAMAATHGGYTIAPYLIFSVSDAVLITDDDNGVEAVQVATPFERLRFEAYREQMMRTPFNADDVATFNRQHDGRVDFIVYAHSKSEKDRAFMDGFGAATLQRPDGTIAATATTSHTVPIVDTYTKAGGVVVSRSLGQVTYRFQLPPDVINALTNSPLTFVFSDDRGTMHRIPVKLADYR